MVAEALLKSAPPLDAEGRRRIHFGRALGIISLGLLEDIPCIQHHPVSPLSRRPLLGRGRVGKSLFFASAPFSDLGPLGLSFLGGICTKQTPVSFISANFEVNEMILIAVFWTYPMLIGTLQTHDIMG